MVRTWSRLLLLASALGVLSGCCWHRNRELAMRYRGQCPEMQSYNQCPCPCPMPCGCEMNGQMMPGMGSTVEPGTAFPGAAPPTIINPSPLPPGTVPPGEARPMPAQPSKNTRTIQPVAKTDGSEKQDK